MQIITTGYSMEMIFLIMLVVGMLVVLALQVLFVEKINSLESDARCREHNHENIMKSVSEINRSLLARDNLDNAKPMKSNNWDSVKNCFKGPVRVEANERN